MTPQSGKGRRPLATSPFKREPEQPIAHFDVGDRVSHHTYGLGRVIGTEETAVTVDFGAQKVRVASPFRRMDKL